MWSGLVDIFLVMFCIGLDCWREVCGIDVGIFGGIILGGGFKFFFGRVMFCGGLGCWIEVCGIFGGIILGGGFRLLLCYLMLLFKRVMFCSCLGCWI